MYIFHFSIFFTKILSCLIFHGGFDFALLHLVLPPLIHLTRAYNVNILTLVTLHPIDYSVIVAAFLLLGKEN